ncbi:MAG TPA: hypothetical protein VNN09_13360 [Candidatus Competibacteraceae bacterium]|nr:hypothetical protein [Candidatus Competibacteraceae bacterium]
MEDVYNPFLADLEQARRDGTLVRIHREELGAAWVDGYVLGLGRAWCLVGVIGDDIRPNGFQALRLEHISNLELPCPNHTFKARALALRGYSRPQPPALDLDDDAALLRDASAAFPLITLYLEASEPDICYVGRVVMLNGDTLFLRCLNPDAEWEREHGRFGLDEITRIDFGGGYEQALALVAGLIDTPH